MDKLHFINAPTPSPGDNLIKIFLSITGDVSELYETKLDPGHWAAFSEDCTGLVKRLPLTEVHAE